MARLVAVDYDPFASQSAQPRLTPVDYDPFAPTLNARASGSAGAVNKKAEAIWGGSFDDWKKRKEADDAERARMVAESEAGNVGSRRAQDFQRKVAALNKEGDQTGDYSADSLRAGRSLEMGMEQGREQIGAGLQFAGETPLALADFFGRIRPKGETEQDRSNPVTEAGKDIRGAAVARQQEIAPLMIDRPDSLLSMQGAKYIAQSALQSAPTTGTGLAAAVINPAAGLSLMGAGAGSAKFADARAEDKNYWLSAEAGAAAAAAEVVPEMLPLGFLSGRLLKHLPGTAMKRMASSPAGRGALLSLSEGASEGVTELSNIAYEIAREGKTYTDEQIANRLIDATAVGTVIGGGMAAVAEATGQSARAYDQSKIADLELENSLRAAIKPRATTARILGPTATPDAAAGAQIADDAFRAAGVGTVAAADIAEQDALARDLDAATRDQLSSETEIDRLLAGTIGAGDGSGNGQVFGDAGLVARRNGADVSGEGARPNADAQSIALGSGGASNGFSAASQIGGALPQQGAAAGEGRTASEVQANSSTPRELPDGTVFLPGNPAEIRQRLADAGSKWQGMAREIDGVQGVRFGRNAWPEVQGVVGGSVDSSGGLRPTAGHAEQVGLTPVTDTNPVPNYAASPESRLAPADVATTQAEAAVDERVGSTIRPTGDVPASMDSVVDSGFQVGLSGPTAGVRDQQGATPAPPALSDLTARRTNSDTKFDERVHDLTDFIALNGGLDRSALESEGIDPANWNSRKAKGQNDKFFGKPLFRKTGGMTLETLREKARDAGFRTDKDVLDLISESLGGRKTFTPAGSEYQMALADVARQEADAQARQQRVNALPLSVPETDADAYIASRETEFDAPADRDGADLADIESTLASVADTSPQQRASVVSLGHDYTAKLIELKRARAAGALNPDQQEAYIDLLERDRETGKVAGRPMAGIGNKTAYVDALMQGKLMPVQAFLDADNFKALNDKFGHDVGDDVIRLIADVVRAEFGEGNVFHRGGDEFLTQGMTQEEVDAKMARVQDYLARVKMELPLSDGRTATLTGVGVSYGTGANEKAADDSLKQDKQRRKDAGLRFDRREGDDAGRVGSQSSGAGTEASGANSRDSSRAAAEGVGDERQNRTNLPDAGSSREVAGRRGDAERAPDDLGGSGPRTEAVRGGQAGSREVSGGIATVRSAISQAIGAKFLRRLESQPWFHLVGTLADLPANIRKSITDGGNVAGFVLGNDVYIIADQASDPVGVTLHEVGVHFGMSGILGADFPAVLRNFKRQRAKDAAVGRAYERATEAAERGEDGELTADALATLDEEALAYYVEANWNAKDSRGIVAKVIDAIKATLNRLGIPLSTLNASPEMLRKVAIGAARKAADGRVSVGKGGGLRYHKAWHGSPHDFDKFRLDDSTIGTGEGAQAFGHGLYFAGREELGEHYRSALSGRSVKAGGKTMSHADFIEAVVEMAPAPKSLESAVRSQANEAGIAIIERGVPYQDYVAKLRSGPYARMYAGLADAIERMAPVKNAGRLYEVELAPNESDYLDFDLPLSELTGGAKAAIFEGGPDGVAGSADTLRNISEREPFLSEGYRGLNIPTKARVLSAMLGATKDGQILKSVVELIPVDVMDIFTRQELSAKAVLGDKAMLHDWLAANSRDPISGGRDAASSVVRAVALAATKQVRGLGLRGSPEKGRSAGSAVADNFHVPIINELGRGATGGDFYKALSRRLGSDKAASAYLRSIGIPGIRYLDGSSRGAGGHVVTLATSKNPNYSTTKFQTKQQAEAYATEKRADGFMATVEIDGSRNFVLFDDSQVEVKAKYSRRADGGSEAPESQKLVALHNISPEGLLFADKIGGLAVPSIGITKAATPFTGFGSVTLIGSRDLATPSGDNPVFSADAFTQRFPDVEWPAVPYKKANDFLASIDPDVRRRDTDELHDHMVNHPDRDKAIDDGRKSATFMKAWLAEVGDAPAQDVTEKRVPPHRAQWAVRPAWTDAVDRLAARGVDVRNLREGSPEWAELDKAAREAIEQEADSYAGLSKTLADEMREDMLAFFGDSLSLGDGDRAIRFAMAKDEAPRVDRYATKKALQDQIGDRMPEFSAWVVSKIAPLFGEPSIRIGRKKVPMTLDNIVEAMTSKSVAGKESTMTFGTGKAKAMNAKRYRTIEEVQADRAKIVSTEAEKGAIDASDKLIEQYRDAVLPYTSEIYNDRIDTWAALDASMKALADAGKKAATAANMRSALARNGFRGVDADTVQLGVNALIALRETVTDYFEAKPQRAVKLSEFAGAVVKSSEADQVRPVLEKHGVEVREYSGEDAERRVAIDEFTKELEAKRGKIRFSRRARTITVDGTERPTTDSTGKAIHPTEEGVRNFWRWFSPSPSQLLDGLSVSEVSGLKRDTEALADFIESQTELSESDRFAVIPPSVFAHVAGAVNNDEILNAVVRSLPVDVVDFLASKKLSPKQVFNDPAMLKDVFSVNPASDVALAVNPARIAEIAVRVVANAGAKISGVTNGALKRNAAMLADKSDPVLGAHVRKSAAGDLGIVAGFGDSKVVDDQGRPLVVYHGTRHNFDEFMREGRRGRNRMHYFASDPMIAGEYAGDERYGTPNVVPAYISVARPYEFDAGGSLWASLPIDLFPQEIAQHFDERNILRGKSGVAARIGFTDVNRAAQSAGYDGVIASNIIDGGGQYGDKTPTTVSIVFAPEQIKSATGNSGAFSPADARIAYSRKTPAEARAESAQKQADLSAQLVVSPGQSFVYADKFTDDWRGQALKMRERIQDKLLSIRNVQQDIEKIRGAIQDAMNVYRRENLMHGRVGEQRDKLQDSHVKPLIEAMAEAKVSPALLEDYLEARHAKERNEKIAATKGGMPDGASGMTTAQAEDFLQGRAAGHRSGVTLDPAMTRQVSRLGRKVYAITAETRRRLLDSGQITQEAFDALENAYAAYVPLRGKDGTESGKGRGTGKGIDVRGKPIQRAAGRGEGNRAQNILAEVIADAERSIINAEKLRVGRTLARLVLENPNPDVWAIEPVKTELKVSDGTPEEIYEAVKNLDQEEGTIIVKVKGKPYRIVIEDQRMADALKNMAVETVPEVIQYVAGLNRYFSAVLTRYNPSFVGVNMTRDLLFGMTGIWAEHGTAAAAKAAASYFPAMRAAWRDIQGKPPVNAMGRYAREFAEAGGKTYFGKLENVSDMSQRIGEEFKTFRQMAMPKFLGGEMSPVRALAKVARDSKMVQAIEAVNDTVENTLRLSVYAARREAGASIEQAAEYAKNISVNFNRRGSATSWLNALYLFFNAATQGAHRTLTLLKNPKVQGVLGGLAALQATSAMFLMGLDDEDGEPLWDSISSWDKQRNLILAIPIKRENGWGATVIKIPMPYGFNLFPYMGGRSVELARDLQEKPAGRAIADYTTDAVVGVAQAMSPIPFDDGWKAALPHWVRIFTVLSENKDDLGIPIRAGDQYDSFDKPRSASGRDDTPLPFKVAATALNRLGGGDDYTPPYAKFALDWAPEDLAYLFKTFAGGLGSNVVKSGTLTEKLIAGVPVNFKDVPVLSSFVSNVDQRQATSTRYYDHKDDIEREVARQRDLAKETGEVGDNQMGIKIARNKSGVKVKRGEGYELEGKPGSLFDTYKQAEKDISRIRDEMRAAFNDQSISYTERIRKIDELKAEREEVQRELNAAWREQRKKRTQ